jgi:hypothetical protein
MLEAWQSVTEPQATIIAGFLTMLAAIGAVLLGSWLFSGRVRDLKGGVEETERILRLHRDEVNSTLAELREGLGQVRGTVSDIQSAAPSEAQNENEWEAWEALRDSWIEIRDELERLAADPTIDGRTRARYGRIDRRQYWKLIEALAGDKRLGGRRRDFEAANNLWQQYKNGRRVPDRAAVNQMQQLRNSIIPAPALEGAA